MKQLLSVFAILAVVIQLSGCSIVGHSNQRFSVQSDPPGALVFIDGNPIGSTPLTTRISRGHNTTVTVRKDGYYAAMMTTSGSLSTLGIIDVIGGCIWLVPFIGLFANGAHHQSPENYTVLLVEQPKNND